MYAGTADDEDTWKPIILTYCTRTLGQSSQGSGVGVDREAGLVVGSGTFDAHGEGPLTEHAEQLTGGPVAAGLDLVGDQRRSGHAHLGHDRHDDDLVGVDGVASGVRDLDGRGASAE